LRHGKKGQQILGRGLIRPERVGRRHNSRSCRAVVVRRNLAYSRRSVTVAFFLCHSFTIVSPSSTYAQSRPSRCSSGSSLICSHHACAAFCLRCTFSSLSADCALVSTT